MKHSIIPTPMAKGLKPDLKKGSFFRTLLLCVLIVYGLSAGAQERLILGVSPWTHEHMLFKWAKPIVQHIESQSTVKVRLKSAKDLKDYYWRSKQGDYDGFIAPMHMGLDLVLNNGFRSLMWVKVGYNVIIVCDKSLDFSELAHLKNHDVVFPSLYATTALLLLQDLKTAGVSVNSHFLKDQWKVIEKLHTGHVQCGGLLSNLFDSREAAFKSRFSVVYRNSLRLDAMLVAPPSTPLKMQQALLTLANGFYDEGSIIARFDLIKPGEIEYWANSLGPMLKTFRQDVLKQ